MSVIAVTSFGQLSIALPLHGSASMLERGERI
jgi:hypothetical protein